MLRLISPADNQFTPAKRCAKPQTMVRCPLCSVSLEPWSAEGHIRDELDAPELRCLLCRVTFFDLADADEHFRGPLAKHPADVEPQLAQVRLGPAKKARLIELLRRAREEQKEQINKACSKSTHLMPDRNGQSKAFYNANVVNEHHPEVKDSGELESVAATSIESSESESDDSSSREEVEVQDANTDAKMMVPDSQSPDSPDDGSGEEEEQAAKGTERTQYSESSNATSPKARCMLCGQLVKPPNLSLHAKSVHMGRPFRCLLCPQQCSYKHNLKLHIRATHKREMTPSTFRCLVTTEQVRAVTARCFGATKLKIPCSECGIWIRPQDARSHVSAVHLKAVMHRCRLCEHTTMMVRRTNVNGHVRRVHKGASVQRTIDSSGLAKHAEEITSIVAKFFPNK